MIIKKLIDISWPISSATTGYKDRNVLSIEPTRSFDRDGVRESKITLSSHTGTHIDAPSHFLRDGKTIDQLSFEKLLAPAVVLDMTLVQEKITRTDLEVHEKKIRVGEIILLKTTNSDKGPTDKFTPHFVYLEESGARYLTQKKVAAVGIDYLGIEHSQQNHETHRLLMEANVTIIEGLRLKAAKPGNYFCICLPLNIIGTEAAPARAVLLEI